MIIDDDRFLLDMYATKFKSSGSEPATAFGASEALTKLRGGYVPDAIVLDIIMPAVDGLELLEMIRKEKLAPNAAVIMLTNESDPSKIEKAKSLGSDEYLIKAMTIPSQVVTKVKGVIEKRQTSK